tara:strand:+ start:130 stop:555 length:426 start_codon:yes stop_codon:yes gene_type:complete
MTYSIIASWDSDGVPTKTNQADTEDQAKELVAMCVSKGNKDAFYLEDKVDDGLEAWRQPQYWKVADGSATLQQSLVDSTELADKWEKIRNQRNTKLAKSDWRAMPDSPTMSSAWKTYRQALRDLPASESDPDDITWPTEPS